MAASALGPPQSSRSQQVAQNIQASLAGDTQSSAASTGLGTGMDFLFFVLLGRN